MNKYQHIIDTLLDRDYIDTVGKPISNWRVKVYPKPRVWINKDTVKQIKNGKKRNKSKL